jgi:hypothetical protein
MSEAYNFEPDKEPPVNESFDSRSATFDEGGGPMSHTLTISQDLYTRLEDAARRRGLHTVERLLQEWEAGERELEQRREAVRQIDAFRAYLFAKYGEMPDSTPLIREDRER